MSKSRKGRRSHAHGKREQVLSGLCGRLATFAKSLPVFGGALGVAPASVVADAVVCHRILSKYEVPRQGDAKARRTESIRSLITSDIPHKVVITDDLEWARLRLHHWFSDFRCSYHFVAPSGASARAIGLDVDILTKLEDLDNWEIAPELLDYAFNIVWRNHALKRLVRSRFRAHYCLRVMNPMFRLKHGLNGYMIFREQFKALVTYNSISRLTTVPKNNVEDRTITCEPLWNMICQLSYMRDLRSHMKRKLGYDLNTRGELHKTLLSGPVATIDLRRASDLISVDLVRKLWPRKMWSQLALLRPKVLEYDVGSGPEFHFLEMFAPMGTGITFDVMTFTLLAILRFDRSASVFGDDIIVKEEYADRAISALKSAGCVVNETKSFLEGPFKESCGGIFHRDIGYIVSYDFWYPSDLYKMILLVNKIHKILLAGQISWELQGILETMRNDLASCIPRDAFGDVQEAQELNGEFVWGLTASAISHSLAPALSSMWHRKVTLSKGVCVESCKSTVKIGDDVSWFGFLLRGDVKRVITKTEIKRITICTWTGRPIRGLPILPITI